MAYSNNLAITGLFRLFCLLKTGVAPIRVAVQHITLTYFKLAPKAPFVLQKLSRDSCIPHKKNPVIDFCYSDTGGMNLCCFYRDETVPLDTATEVECLSAILHHVHSDTLTGTVLTELLTSGVTSDALEYAYITYLVS